MLILGDDSVHDGGAVLGHFSAERKSKHVRVTAAGFPRSPSDGERTNDGVRQIVTIVKTLQALKVVLLNCLSDNPGADDDGLMGRQVVLRLNLSRTVSRNRRGIEMLLNH